MNTSTGVGFPLVGAVAPTSLGQTPNAGISFGNIAAQSTPVQNLPTSTQAPTFGVCTPSAPSTQATSATSGFSLLPTTSATVAPLNTTTSATLPTTTTSGLLFGAGLTMPSVKTTKSVTFSLTSQPSTSTAASLTKSILKPASTSSAASTSSTITTSSSDQQINYVQLQDLTSKWMSDFEDLQKLLLNQTAETINRDVILATNEDKIEKLVNSVQNVKSEQTLVEQQLDFILSQQKDLEECLESLEDEVSSYFPELPADDMYKLAENIDSRLKKTLETSKEIITKINDKNRLSENAANPMVAIGRILNHLTNSIQMLELMNAEGQSKLNDLQKMYQHYTA